MNSIQANYGITKRYEDPTPETETDESTGKYARPVFKANVPQDGYYPSYQNYPPQDNRSFLARNWGKILTIGILAALSFSPKARHMAKNLFGKKGCQEFIDNSKDDALKTIMKDLKAIKGFEGSTEGLSSFNLTTFARTVKENPSIYKDLISGKIKVKAGKDAAQAVIDLNKLGGYDLLDAVSENRSFVQEIAEYGKKLGKTPNKIVYTKQGTNTVSAEFSRLISQNSTTKTSTIEKAEQEISFSKLSNAIKKAFSEKNAERVSVEI